MTRHCVQIRGKTVYLSPEGGILCDCPGNSLGVCISADGSQH
jgi:hypothetical protein